LPQRIALTEAGTISSFSWATARTISAKVPILREIVHHGWLRPLAQWHGRVVNKARIAPEPAGCAQRSCPAVRAFLRPFKGNSPTTVGWGIGHRAETSEAVVTSTLHPPRRRYGWADGIGAAAVLECPEEATRGICRAISQVLLHMDGNRVRTKPSGGRRYA
jgi:hypothetical protein